MSSPQLAILRDKGVLVTRKDANRVYYRIGDARTLQLIGMMREVSAAHDGACISAVVACPFLIIRYSLELRLEFIQQNIYLFAIALVSGLGLLVLTFRRPGDRNSLSTTQATRLINRDDALVIDVREPDEYVTGHLPSRVISRPASLAIAVGELSFKDKPLILVCQTGSRSTAACKQLMAQGFARAHNLEGGIAGWRLSTCRSRRRQEMSAAPRADVFDCGLPFTCAPNSCCARAGVKSRSCASISTRRCVSR